MREQALCTLVLLALALGAVSVHGATVDFEKDIRGLLNDRCIECHGAKKQKAGLRLDARIFVFKGSTNGPILAAGKSGESELVRRLRSDDKDEQMPPKGERLSRAQIEAVAAWIDGGAVWTESEADRTAAKDRRLDHWAWQPVRRPAVPASADQNPIDAFIRAKLAAHGLQPSPEADRRTLIRRLSFDLLGLPPAPEEVERFVADPAADAYECKVEEYLASPHYGERWARHWLDIAHYADTHGFERDQRRDHAWPYRDYVIRALNEDKRYDDFLREQVAGDVLRPNDPEAVAATGFLAAGPWDYVGQVETKSETLRRAARADDLDDMVTQVMTAACGVTINCARCHDHKIDPIAQREYYGLWAVFAGVKRGDRAISSREQEQYAARKSSLESGLRSVRGELAKLHGQGYDLADIVGGGDGLGSGKRGLGIDPLSGQPLEGKRGFLQNVQPNHFVKSTVAFVDGVVIPGGGDAAVPITSTGLTVRGVPKTSGQAWDGIRNGPVNSQFTTTLDGIDFGSADHTLLALHANAAITFDLAALRQAGAPPELRFRATAGYFGMTPKKGASFHVYVDGEDWAGRDLIGHDDGAIEVDVTVPAIARFLTLMATDGGNGISHDQICFADARLVNAAAETSSDVTARRGLERRRGDLQRQIKALSEPEKVYAVTSEAPPEIKVLRRGDPEQPAESVTPQALACFQGIGSALSTEATEGRRRASLAEWIVSPANPLTRRVIVNRLWHYHFGVGLVDTPSDFGLGGGKPSHPELLDWLAEAFRERGWSLKAMHRLICTSATYKQSSKARPDAAQIDANNRLLWRMNPRRLEAEAVRDAVLTVSGKLNSTMYGPGYRDFAYTEAYAPIYQYVAADEPDLWRRSVYRFIVRTTTHQFLTTLDCPNPANLTPARNITTTALQSLALLNNAFMLKQAGYFADRVRAESPADATTQVRRAFALAFGRLPAPEVERAAADFVRKQGLAQLCRMLFNANEFIYAD